MPVRRNDDETPPEIAPWNEYRLLVLSKFKTLEQQNDSIEERLKTISTDVNGLKVTAAAWGFACGAILPVVTFAFEIVKWISKS